MVVGVECLQRPALGGGAEANHGKDNVLGQEGQEEVMRKLQTMSVLQRSECEERLEGGAALPRDGGTVAEEGDEGNRQKFPELEFGAGGMVDDTEDGLASFLPQRLLHVLLVEDDESTRHVVGALLRNCRYEVTPASNGLHAWELLESKKYKFDIVLTDVIMPGLSGLTLLGNIMAGEEHKGLPVIMMSANDSMDIVLRCFQKGASDFLVKPVRKNELKNLWQHVWRKSASSSGTGSGSGSLREKMVQPESGMGSAKGSGNGDNCMKGNNSGSGSGSSLNGLGGSDNGSGTQMDVSKQQRDGKDRKAELSEAEQAGSESEDKEDGDGSRPQETPQPMRPLQGASAAVAAAAREKEQQHAVEKDCASPEEPSLSPSLMEQPSLDVHEMEDGEIREALATEMEHSAPLVQVIDLLGEVGKGQTGVAEEAAGEDGERVHRTDGAYEDNEELDRGASNSPKAEVLPVLELSLKRSRDQADDDCEDRKVLRQSEGSAFSRYNTSGVSPSQSRPSLTPPGFSHSTLFSPKPLSQRGTFATPDSVVPVAAQPRTVPNNATDLSSPDGTGNWNGVSGGSGGMGGTGTGNGSIVNGSSANGSAFGSQNRSNGLRNNGSTNDQSGVLNGAMATDADGGEPQANGSSGVENAASNGGTLGAGNGGNTGAVVGPVQNRTARREAALNKFRQKRKERCFEKKVRYQSRKRLAEQRPRVRGQFVRQVALGDVEGRCNS